MDRRRALALLGASVAAAAGCVDVDLVEDDDPGPPPADEQEWAEIQSVILEGTTDAWTGLEPDLIDGEDNPEIILNENQEYEVSWTNADGEPHALAIVTDEGDILDDLQTDVVDQEGEGGSLTVEPTEEMAYYVCTEHENTQRGELVYLTELDDDHHEGGG